MTIAAKTQVRVELILFIKQEEKPSYGRRRISYFDDNQTGAEKAESMIRTLCRGIFAAPNQDSWLKINLSGQNAQHFLTILKERKIIENFLRNRGIKSEFKVKTESAPV